VLEGPLKKFHVGNKWAHSSCVLFGWEGFHYEDEVRKRGVQANMPVWQERDRWLKCKFCGEAKFNLQCAEKKCAIAFHATCAKKRGYKSVYQSVDLDWIDDPENNWDVVRYFLCNKHRDMDVSVYVENHKKTLGKAGEDHDDDPIVSPEQQRKMKSFTKKTKKPTPRKKPSKKPSLSKSASSASSSIKPPSSTPSSPKKKQPQSDELFEELDQSEVIESRKSEHDAKLERAKNKKNQKN